MTLRYALLAALSAGPMTGYDAAKRFDSGVGFVWHAANSQIYPELRKMEKEGLLDAREIPWGSKGVTKTEYSVNDKGMTALRRWQAEPTEYTPPRDPARLKATYFEMTTPQVAANNLREHISHFDNQRRQAIDEINRINSGTHPVVAKRLENLDPDQWEPVLAFRRFAYEGRARQAEMEIEWAQRGLQLLEELYGPPESWPQDPATDTPLLSTTPDK